MTLTFIVGTTATGKSARALQLATATPSIILSADSRQVYSDIPILSGADIQADWTQTSSTNTHYRYFQTPITEVHGVSIIDKQDEWSVAHFRQLAEECFIKAQQEFKQLIIVGGTGLYHRSLFLDESQLYQPPNTVLRAQLEQYSIEELQELAEQKIDDARLFFNDSDWQNPRRLVRFLEKQVTVFDKKPKVTKPSLFDQADRIKWVGLQISKELLEVRIKQRVVQRIELGAIQEVERLRWTEQFETLPISTTLGIKQILLYLDEQISKEELIEMWSKKEFQYAKRQLTWFNKETQVQWESIPV